MPTVSVIIPSYNHEKYIAETIQSILDQSFQDFEILITDDASTDNSVEKIKAFKDPRIQLFCFSKNQGISRAIDNSIGKAKGEYIALLGSDDIATPDRLEKQVNFLNTNNTIGAVFSRAFIIDENGSPFTNQDHFYYSIFDKEKNRSRFEWLNYFFHHGNCLCAPSALIRKSVYDKTGGHNSCYLQLQDFDLWIRLCLTDEIYILDEKLMKYRVRSNNMNVSSNRVENHIRGEWEHKHILNHYFKINTLDELLKIFPELKNQYSDFVEDLVPFYLAMLCLKTKSDFHVYAAVEALYHLLQSSPDLLAEKANFSYPDFFNILATTDVFHYKAKIAQPEKERLEKEMELVLNSTSWKFTKPLRWLKSKVS